MPSEWDLPLEVPERGTRTPRRLGVAPSAVALITDRAVPRRRMQPRELERIA